MKAFWWALFISLLLFCAPALGEGGVGAKYDMEITLMKDAQALYVRQNVRVKNDTGAALGRAVFCVYANCFRRELTLPYDNAALQEAFPDYYAPSGVDMH